MAYLKLALKPEVTSVKCTQQRQTEIFALQDTVPVCPT